MRRLHAFAASLLLACAASPSASDPGTGRSNPIGLMLAAPGLTQSQEVDLAHSLGAAYYRPSSAIFLDRWTGSCAECALGTQAGMKLILSVSTGRTDGMPASPPTDLQAYRTQVADVLAKVHPFVLSVENEENSQLFYAGTPEQYGVELRAACDVAHAQGILCTNGGLVSKLVALLVYDDYQRSGKSDLARSFAQRVFTPAEQALLGSPAVLDHLDKGHRLIDQYRASGVDYVNFHWYIPDAAALAEGVDYLKRATGKAVMTNEMGQQDQLASTVTSLLGKALELQLPIVVWYSIDSPLAFALTDASGGLRAGGQAFQTFMRSHGWAK